MKIIRRDTVPPKFDDRLKYCGGIGWLNLLEKSMCPNISFATNQCEQLPKEPRAPHGTVVNVSVKYLGATKNNRLVLDPKKTQRLEVYADSDFIWN